MAKYLCGTQNDLEGTVGFLICLLMTQFIYTCIVWGVVLGKHVINSILMGLMMIPFVIAMFLICRYSSKKDDGDSTAKRASEKCMIVACFIMVLFSFIPLFGSLLEIFDDPIT